MFIHHQNKAYHISLRVSLIIVYCGLIFLNVFFDDLEIQYKYDVLVAAISLVFSLIHILYAILLDRFENK